MEPLTIGPISNLEELEMKTLQFQNQKLGMRLNQRIQIEDDLRLKIDKLEQRQTQDDAVINVIHRYWNQLNEDIRILLLRFDAETGDESEKDNESESTKSFLAQLATWHKEELDEKLANKVQVSQRAVAKIIQVFDHMIQRNEKLSQSLSKPLPAKTAGDGGEGDSQDGKDGEKKSSPVKKEKEEKDVKKEASEDDKASSESVKVKEEPKDDKDTADKVSINLDAEVKRMNEELTRQNKALHHLNTSLHEKNHFLSLKEAEFEERILAETTKNEELQNKLDDMEYENTKLKLKNGKLEAGLIETQETLKMYVDKDGGKMEQKVVLSNAERKSVEQLNQDLEEQRELATNRHIELEEMSGKYKSSLKEVERLKMELSTLPEHVVVETTEHKCLQSRFSVLYNEAMQLKTQLEDARNQLQVAKNAHIRQIEQMEAEELLAQKKLRAEAIQLEDLLAQVRKEYEMLRIEFEQNLAANEQTGPINKEMRNLITSLQTHNVQLKGGIGRYKRRLKESNSDLVKLRKELEEYKAAEIKALQAKKAAQAAQAAMAAANSASGAPGSSGGLGGLTGSDLIGSDSDDVIGVMMTSQQSAAAAGGEAAASGTSGTSPSGAIGEGGVSDKDPEDSSDPMQSDALSMEDAACDDSPDSTGATPTAAAATGSTVNTPVKGGGPGTPAAGTPKKIGEGGGAQPATVLHQLTKEKFDEVVRARSKDQELIKDLRNQVKKALKEMNEMKLLLDIYKACPQEKRDKAMIMAAEKKARQELDDVKAQLKKVSETKRDEKKRLADEDATRRIKQLEEQVAGLGRQAVTLKQDEEALTREMDITGEAFEDLQEQNARLIEQLREKDDANFKLMSERIKLNQIQQTAREERDTLIQQGTTLSTQVEAQNQVVRKLEEKERLLQSSLVAMDKELAMRQQAMEMHKRKAIESAQSAADLKLHLEKYHLQIEEVQQTVTEKTSSLEGEAFKTKRLQEELGLVKRKVERLRKIEMATDTNMDQILKEEVREYKETLTCPSCKVKRKDAVLTKCFHCFCYDCLRTRYETRQRKCPKCNAAFGASDYHRLYLS